METVTITRIVGQIKVEVSVTVPFMTPSEEIERLLAVAWSVHASHVHNDE